MQITGANHLGVRRSVANQNAMRNLRVVVTVQATSALTEDVIPGPVRLVESRPIKERGPVGCQSSRIVRAARFDFGADHSNGKATLMCTNWTNWSVPSGCGCAKTSRRSIGCGQRSRWLDD